MVSVWWEGVWYCSLTNVLDPQVLSARQVCELYRRRWRIEDAFALTKRVLDLAYLWTASTNAVQLQIYATLIFYAVLLMICQQVAEVLGEPLERLSVEMVFRALYH
jgi:IS4 transposase